MQNRLLKSLCEIAAKEMKITKGVNPQWKEKADLLVIAYGQSAVEADFVDWIESVRESRPENPVTDYLKLIDERLGNAPATSEDDPQVTSLIASAYKASGRPPAKSDIQKLLDLFSKDEIQAAWDEYTNRLDENELKYAVKNFFRDGGGRGIIVARRQMKDEQVARIKIETVSAQLAEEAHCQNEDIILRRRLEEEEVAARVAANPDALFGG